MQPKHIELKKKLESAEQTLCTKLNQVKENYDLRNNLQSQVEQEKKQVIELEVK